VRDKLIELLIDGHKLYLFYDQIADYLLANGIIMPPCKVGDAVWIVYTPKWPANPADKGKWFMIEDGVQRIIYGAKGLSIETWNMGTIPAKDIGKKLFFDKEEAERVLIERRGDNE
jgi:hypothetical protein